MSEFFTFVEVGFRHISDLAAADHILFLLALSAIYRGRDWRELLVVISAFTVGHSITLVLSVTDVLRLEPSLVEFLIPVTIVLTGIENLRRVTFGRSKRAVASGTFSSVSQRTAMGFAGMARAGLACVFGFIHGAGFAGYLRNLFVDDIAAPLFGFNAGIELGQIAVLAVAGACFAMADRVIAMIPALTARGEPRLLRSASISVAVSVVATFWAFERFPA